MFSRSADLYDIIYASFKNFPAEATQLAALIRREHPEARTVLDVACGTAEHARLLTEEHGFAVDGLDLDPAFVRIAEAKLPCGSVFLGDMTSFDLGRRYDVVLCLFSSIGYVRTLDNVTRSLRCFRQHLAPGGLVLVEPWFPPGFLQPGRSHAICANGDGVSVCRMSRMEVTDRISRLHFEYLIGRPAGIEHTSELHELGLFTTEELLACFEAAGLRAEHDPVGPYDRGLFTARRAE